MKYFFLSFICIMISIVFCFLFINNNPYYNIVDIEFFLNRKPYIQVKVNDAPHFSSFSTFYPSPFALTPDTLKSNKEWDLSRIEIGSKVIEHLKHVVLDPLDRETVPHSLYRPKFSTTLGSFENEFVVVDYSKNCLVISESKEGLKLAGYEVDSWSRIPLEKNEFGAFQVFVELNDMPLYMNLDTAAQTNHILSSVVTNEEKIDGSYGLSVEAKKLVLGLEKYDTESFLVNESFSKEAPSGFLGAPFFIGNTVCFDLKNYQLFLLKNNKEEQK